MVYEQITPGVWGPVLWRAIHFVALGYPENPTAEHVQSYGNFFVEALPDVIPCKMCSDNYKRHLNELPISPFLHEGGKHKLFEWTVEMHNIVNKELGKSKFNWTPEEALGALLGKVEIQSESQPIELPLALTAQHFGNVALIGVAIIIAVIIVVMLIAKRK